MLLKTKTRPGIILLLVLFFCSCFSAGNAAAQGGPIGKIIALRGQAVASSASGSRRQLAIGNEIAIAEVVTTGRRCRMQIMFADSTIVSLGPSSEFVVKDYSWDAETQQGGMKSQVNEGVFRVLGGSITKSSPQNFITETPSATIGIRGSMYAGRVRDGQLAVVFQGGKGIYVRNPLGSVELSIPGYGTRLLSSEQPPQEPYQFTPQELDQLDPVVAVAPAVPSGSPAEGGEPSTELPAELGEADEALPPPADPYTTDLPTIDETPIAGGDSSVTETVAEAVQEETLSVVGTGGTAVVSGRFTAVQDDLFITTNVADITWTGALNGMTSAGNLTSTASTNNGTFAISPFFVSGYDPSLPYTGSIKQQNVSRTVSLLGSPVTFNTATISTDNTGEFSVFVLGDTFTPGYQYSEIGFLGTPTLSPDMPTTGLSRYGGPMVGSLTSLISTDFETLEDSFDLSVNWHNGKVMGAVLAGGKAVGFFIGDVSGTGFNTSLFFGNDITDFGSGPILAISGSESFAQFYGNQFQGVGFDLGGSTHNILTQLPEENWLLTGAGFRTPTIAPTTTGNVVWEGFVVGIGEDMNQIDVDRRLFMNSVGSDFSLNINRDSGNIIGSLNVMDIQSAANINGLVLGGGNGSAFLSEQLLATGIGGTPLINGTGTTLKTYGNYLITEDPAIQLATYVSWGSWEIAYTEPGSGDEYHVHVPGSYWVAGRPTTVAELGGLNFSATYNCKAEGAYVQPTGQFDALPTGGVTFNVDFSTSTLTSGSISFPAGASSPALNVSLDPTSISATGFNAMVSSPDTGSVNGMLYGPAAQSAAGNFEVMMSTDRYIGIFGGDR